MVTGNQSCGPIEEGQLRVLVVDDQPSVCEVVADTIRYAGHRVVGTASDGIEAIGLAKKLQPHLIVMDVSMPRMNGVEAMQTIRADDASIRVLLMSGEYRSLGFTREDMLRRGAFAFLEKPFNVVDLFDLLEKISAEVHDKQKQRVQQS